MCASVHIKLIHPLKLMSHAKLPGLPKRNDKVFASRLPVSFHHIKDSSELPLLSSKSSPHSDRPKRRTARPRPGLTQASSDPPAAPVDAHVQVGLAGAAAVPLPLRLLVAPQRGPVVLHAGDGGRQAEGHEGEGAVPAAAAVGQAAISQ